jgi:hypothetical protein
MCVPSRGAPGRTVVRAANGPELKLDEGIDVRDGRGELLHHGGEASDTREGEGTESLPLRLFSKSLATARHATAAPHPAPSFTTATS